MSKFPTAMELWEKFSKKKVKWWQRQYFDIQGLHQYQLAYAMKKWLERDVSPNPKWFYDYIQDVRKDLPDPLICSAYICSNPEMEKVAYRLELLEIYDLPNDNTISEIERLRGVLDAWVHTR